jgi:hypothetical protein
MNKEVSFPIAKLLKEKGFNLKVITFYDYERLSTPFDKQRQVDGLINYNPINWNSVKEHYTSAPTIAEVVMWLYAKNLLWVYAHKDGGWWFPVIENYYDEDEQGTIIESLEGMPKIQFNSPTEAYEAAIEYTLENLIK